MAVWLLGGTNAMVGMGCGIAIIMMSSTPFWLANTGGSTIVSAVAVPTPAHKAVTKPATPTHRLAENSHAFFMLDMCSPLYDGLCV
jgi:hypothetical protein